MWLCRDTKVVSYPVTNSTVTPKYYHKHFFFLYQITCTNLSPICQNLPIIRADWFLLGSGTRPDQEKLPQEKPWQTRAARQSVHQSLCYIRRALHQVHDKHLDNVPPGSVFAGLWGVASRCRLERERRQLDVAVMQFIFPAVFPLLLPRGLRPAHRPQRGLHKVGTFPGIAPWCQPADPPQPGWHPSSLCLSGPHSITGTHWESRKHI